MSRDLEAIFSQAKAGKTAPMYLLWGDEFLVRQVSEQLVQALLPDASIGLNLSVLDGASVRDIANDLATLPLFPGRKIVLVHDPEFLAPKKGRVDALSKAKDAWKSGKRKEAARRVLAIAARAGWSAANLDPSHSGSPSPGRWNEELGIELADADVSFLGEIAAFCKEERITAPEGDSSVLLELFEKGLAEGQIFIVAATDLDAKNPLVKWAQKSAVVIERKVAGRLKELDVTGIAAAVLAPHGKRLAPAAATLLKQRCGANMRLLQSELEKLAVYVEKPVIQAADVELLVGHAREDEFLELSDALQKRDFKAALDYVNHALDQGTHALPLLGSVATGIRTLIENRMRLQTLAQGTAPRSFEDFKRSLFPRIEKEAEAAGSKVPHPYGAFLGMQAAGRYSVDELLRALVACAEADVSIKSSGSMRLATERVLWTLCQPGKS